MEQTATARAYPNIALAKYWGKRDSGLNLPAVGSISLTLDSIYTQTAVTFSNSLSGDRFTLNGKAESGDSYHRVRRFLNFLRDQAGTTAYANVVSTNNFPTGAGLASSASGFAALALAGSMAAGLSMESEDLSRLARRGSGSAARSIYGGWVEMRPGERKDGTDSYAVQLHTRDYWDIRMMILVLSETRKPIGSTSGMINSAESSPYYPAWVNSAPAHLDAIRHAIDSRDFHRVGELMEESALRMHAVALSASPGILYWNGTTVDILHTIRRLRKEGFPAYFTIDAGPQVKVLTPGAEAEGLRERLTTLTGVKRIITTRPGPGVNLIEETQ